MSMTKKNSLNIFAMLCALWFIATGWIWVYYVNLIISFPFAFIGLYCWKKGRDTVNPSTLNTVAFWLLVAGFILSFGWLATLLIFN